MFIKQACSGTMVCLSCGGFSYVVWLVLYVTGERTDS